MTVNRDPTVDIILGSAVRNMHRSKPDLVQRSGIQVSEISEKSRRNWRTWNAHQDWRKRLLRREHEGAWGYAENVRELYDLTLGEIDSAVLDLTYDGTVAVSNRLSKLELSHVVEFSIFFDVPVKLKH